MQNNVMTYLYGHWCLLNAIHQCCFKKNQNVWSGLELQEQYVQ